MATKKEKPVTIGGYSDLDLVKLFINKETFEKYHHFITKEAVLEETWMLLDGIRDYYADHPASEEIVWSSFRAWFLLKNSSKLGPVRTSTLAGIIDGVAASPDPSEDADELIEFFVSLYYASKLKEHGDAVLMGRKGADIADAQELIDKYLEDKAAVKHENLEDFLDFSDMESVYDKIYRTGGLEWRLEDLNVSVGPVRDGDLICITACPNVGKTRMITSEITHMVKQLPEEDRRILFFNNEETKEAVWNAIYCSYFNKTDDEVSKDVKKYEEQWNKEVGKESVAVLHRPAGNVKDIERAIKAFNPKIVVYNQLYKVHLFGHHKATEAEQYRLRYNFARVMADKYQHVAIAAHQAGAIAAGEKRVTQEMMYGGKTGIPGECDVIIGIGKTYDPADKPYRYLYIARNKLPSGPRTNPVLREDSEFKVKFEAARGRYVTTEFK